MKGAIEHLGFSEGGRCWTLSERLLFVEGLVDFGLEFTELADLTHTPILFFIVEVGVLTLAVSVWALMNILPLTLLYALPQPSNALILCAVTNSLSFLRETLK